MARSRAPARFSRRRSRAGGRGSGRGELGGSGRVGVLSTRSFVRVANPTAPRWAAIRPEDDSARMCTLRDPRTRSIDTPHEHLRGFTVLVGDRDSVGSHVPCIRFATRSSDRFGGPDPGGGRSRAFRREAGSPTCLPIATRRESHGAILHEIDVACDRPCSSETYPRDVGRSSAVQPAPPTPP